MQHTLPLGERSAHTAEKERQSGDTDYECMVYPHLSGISSEHILCNIHRRVVLSHGKAPSHMSHRLCTEHSS